MQLLLDCLREHVSVRERDPLIHLMPFICQYWRSTLASSSKQQWAKPAKNLQLQQPPPQSPPPSSASISLFLVLSHSHPFHMLLKKSENGFHWGQQSGQTLLCTRTHPQAPLLECQVSSSGTAAIAAVSSSSTPWLLYPGGRMLVSLPRLEWAPLLWGMCPYGNNLHLLRCYSLLSVKNMSVCLFCLTYYHNPFTRLK